MSTVSLIKLLKRFDGIAVVDLDIPLDLRSGEVLYVLGPSGAGKTLLARLIAGLTPLDDGEIFFDGRLMNSEPPLVRKVGLMLGDDGLWPHLSVAENVGLGLRGRGYARRERRDKVEEALATVKIESHTEDRVENLTQIQRRRTALARALAVDPLLLVLDEPLGQLDQRGRDEFREDLQRIFADKRITTIVLTSSAREALAMAERVAILDLGRIIQVGPPLHVYNHPANALVARFSGDVNLIPGQVEGPGGRGELVIRSPIGRMIALTSSNSITVGTPVTLAIRPESMSISAQIPAGANRFPATVERQVFLGEVRQIYLRGPSDWPLMALTLQSQSGGLREGQSLSVSILPEFVVLLTGKNPLGESLIP